MDATKLIEEAGREIAHMKAEALSAANPYNENTIRLTLLIDLAAALKASEERARKAEELAAANLAANKRIVKLEQELSEEQQLTEDASRLVVGCLDALGANIAKMAAEPYDAEKLNALRRGIPDRIRALRLELARLTTPRPIVEAPRDGTWVLLPFSTSKWDACRGPSPQYVTARWFAAAWADPNGALLTEPSHYLPLPDVKP